MKRVYLNRTSRLRSGHLWVFSNEIYSSLKDYSQGELVEIYSKTKEFLGIGYINPHSLISIRILTKKKEPINRDFFYKRIINALKYRERFLPGNSSFRVIYSEGDFLPGIIVDKYADCLVIQILTFGMERLAQTIIDILDEIFSPNVIVLKNDSHTRVLEGLPIEKKIIKGTLEVLPIIKEGDLFFEVDPFHGQKTGFFLDQRENRIALGKYIKKGRGLDLFCYSGAWGLQLAKNGAYVTFVDESDFSLTMAKKNASLNNLIDRCNFVKDDVFSFLKKDIDNRSLYDFIILDPPAFVKSRQKIKDAIRGYREINSMAMRLIKDNGIIATSSCSYHIDKNIFSDMLLSSARDSNKVIRVIEYRSQGRDHPVLLSVPETEYLKCFILQLQG